MKNLIKIALLLIWQITLLNAQSEKTLVMSIELKHSNEIQCILPGEVEYEEWDKPYLRMVVEIKSNTSDDILEQLMLAGRYKAVTYYEFGMEYLTMPKVAKQVILQGVNVEEKFTFKLLIPKGTRVHSTLPDYIVGRK